MAARVRSVVDRLTDRHTYNYVINRRKSWEKPLNLSIIVSYVHTCMYIIIVKLTSSEPLSNPTMVNQDVIFQGLGSSPRITNYRLSFIC